VRQIVFSLQHPIYKDTRSLLTLMGMTRGPNCTAGSTGFAGGHYPFHLSNLSLQQFILLFQLAVDLSQFLLLLELFRCHQLLLETMPLRGTTGDGSLAGQGSIALAGSRALFFLAGRNGRGNIACADTSCGGGRAYLTYADLAKNILQLQYIAIYCYCNILHG